jgi:hypothetical protein
MSERRFEEFLRSRDLSAEWDAYVVALHRLAGALLAERSALESFVADVLVTASWPSSGQRPYSWPLVRK